MNNKVLIVDDDKNLLHSLRRRLGRRFTVMFAQGAEEGLALLGCEGPFAVIVSDQNMKHMNGIEFLGEVRKRAPDTVRIMLTGIANTQLASDAVNEAGVFRFLAKPCSIEDLVGAVQEGVTEYWMNADDSTGNVLTAL